MPISALNPLGELQNDAEFATRHIGPDADDERHMLSVIGAASRRALIDGIVPRNIRRERPMALPAPVGEAQALAELRRIASKNRVLKSFIGQGYHGTHTPGVIQQYGGKFVVRGGRTDSLEGGWNPGRVVVVEFPDLAAARRFYDSPEYQKILPLRLRASNGRAILVEGI